MSNTMSLIKRNRTISVKPVFIPAIFLWGDSAPPRQKAYNPQMAAKLCALNLYRPEQ